MQGGCRECIHYNACGSASMYSDPSGCKQYVHKSAMVPITEARKAWDELDARKKKIDELKSDIRVLKAELADANSELRDLRLIKQTLEMASGLKFDFTKEDYDYDA